MVTEPTNQSSVPLLRHDVSDPGSEILTRILSKERTQKAIIVNSFNAKRLLNHRSLFSESTDSKSLRDQCFDTIKRVNKICDHGSLLTRYQNTLSNTLTNLGVFLRKVF